jgi:hypothetical protein
LDEVVPAARSIAERVVWATVTTVSPAGEPRSRLMHPVWFWERGPVPEALVSSRTTPLKRRHLAANPRVSCSYWDPAHETLVVDATAEWVAAGDLPAVWQEVAAVAPPVGFDPAMVWPEGPNAPDCGFLRFTATRIVASRTGSPPLLWSAAREG